MNRYHTTIIFLFIILFFAEFSSAGNSQADSLMNLFKKAKTQQDRMYSCLNLDNYYRNILREKQIKITNTLLDEGIKAKDQYIITDALRKLVLDINRKTRRLTNDSVQYYLNIAEKSLTGQWKKSFITEVHLMNIRSIAEWMNDENKIISELTNKYTNDQQNNNNDIYYDIERNYALGMAATLTISESGVDSFQNALRYYDQLLDLLKRLPIEYRAQILFWVNENIYLVYTNAEKDDKAVDFLESMMVSLGQYKKLPYVKRDIYQNFPYVYSLYYSGMAHCPHIIGHKRAFDYLKKTEEICRKDGDLMSLYFAYNSYYKKTGDKRKQIMYQDSLVNILNDSTFNSSKAAISFIYKERAENYAALNDYKNAYKGLLDYDSLQQQIMNENSKELRMNMDARYDLNQLELEKEKLVSRNRQILLILFGIILLLAVIWGITQRISLNKLKRMQKSLVESNQEVMRQSMKAQESEKMKTAFINSMCHEIRTPLNAINGFSDLLLDKSLDDESKKEFPEHIRLNTHLLTQLLNDLLEVANLNSSSENMQTEDVDIKDICEQEMKKLISLSSKNIKYSIHTDDKIGTVKTNHFYLSKVITNLLNNAYKFTENGQISLNCHKESDGRLMISVSDTGIGIPKDKHEWVFERFTKIDEHKPGTGLGLYLCRVIIERLGGTIYIDSEYDEGTRFVVVLPL